MIPGAGDSCSHLAVAEIEDGHTITSPRESEILPKLEVPTHKDRRSP
jgi:hypothetical protein